MKYIFVAFLIGLAILIHEAGHFIFARFVRMPIQIFSIGMGPKVWGKEIGGTEYRISLIPFGGYVLPEIEDEEQFFNLPVYKRVVMSIGGPLASLILPIFCFMIINIFMIDISFYNVIIAPFIKTAALFYNMLISLPALFSHSDQVSGIVGIIAQGGEIIKNNFFNALGFTGIISTNFALLNLLPLPVLDGGKILLYLMEKIHPVFKKLHYPLALTGWVLIMGLMLYVTVLDIFKYVV